MRLYDLAVIMRSKNAGPHLITIDVMFRDSRDVDRVLSSAEFTPRAIGRCFNLNEEDIQIRTHRSACAIKVTLPRVRGACTPRTVPVISRESARKESMEG